MTRPIKKNSGQKGKNRNSGYRQKSRTGNKASRNYQKLERPKNFSRPESIGAVQTKPNPTKKPKISAPDMANKAPQKRISEENAKVEAPEKTIKKKKVPARPWHVMMQATRGEGGQGKATKDHKPRASLRRTSKKQKDSTA